MCTVLFVISLLCVQSTSGQEPTVAEEILKILHDNGQISTQQYHQLLKKARIEHKKRTQTILEQASQERKKERMESAPKIDPRTMTAYWKNGMHFDSLDEQFKLRIGGRLLNDWAYIDADNDVENLSSLNKDDDFGSGTEFRQARIYIKGSVYDRLTFKAQYDFAGGDVDFNDTWLGFKDIPYLGNIQIGHFKEPFSLNELISRKHLTFMERSLPGQAGRGLVPGRNTGVMVFNTALNKKMTWAIGGFRETDGFGNSFGEDEIYNLTSRITGLPYYADEGGKLVHLGLGYSHKWMDNNATIRFRARPEAHLTGDFVDTSDIPADGVDLINPELALVYGPFSFQGEYMHGIVDIEHGHSPDFNGYYLQSSYFLTGEHRNYERSTGVFGRVRPYHNFNPQNSEWGALEAAFRYSNIDLDDEGVDTGELEDITLGLNWYLYPNLKFMFNYVYADLDDVGDTNIFQSRFQIDF
jgi:phosphate-selective porin OprO/OprP